MDRQVWSEIKNARAALHPGDRETRREHESTLAELAYVTGAHVEDAIGDGVGRGAFREKAPGIARDPRQRTTLINVTVRCILMLRLLNGARMPFRQDLAPVVSCLTFVVFALR
jgi:hypothetical protein